MKKSLIHLQRYIITIGCLAVLVFATLAYMYFLSLSVVHVVMRKDIMQDINQLRSEVAFLESAYIEANYVISQKVATVEGFSTVPDKIFIHKDASQGLVLRNQNE